MFRPFQDRRALADQLVRRVLQHLQRNNPGANYAVNIAQIPGVETDPMNPNNVTGICNPNCVPITSLKQLENT